MALGERLKEARTKKDFTQEYAAKRLGITFQALSNYERNIRDPDTELLKKMADLYEVTTDFLLGRTDVRNYLHTRAAHVAESTSISDDALVQIEEIIKKEREKLNKEKGR